MGCMINPHNAHLSIFTAVPGWETPHEQGLLLSLASAINPAYGVYDSRLIVEIGSEFGMSASLFALGAPQAYIICIDINPDAPFMDNLRETKLNIDNVHPLFGDSQKIAIMWERYVVELQVGKEIDLLFIDGDHSYNGALSDLTRYTPHVKHGGFLAIHDCAVKTNIHPHESHHEVYNAVHKWLAENGSRDGFRFMFSVDSTMVFRRMK